MKLYLRLLFVPIAIGLAACSSEDDSVKPLYSNLVESEYISGQSASQMGSYLQIYGIDIPSEDLQYNVEIFKVTYETTYKGNKVNASGLVIIPSTEEPVGMISFQHGTIAAHSEAPTAQTGNGLILYAALASPGFIVVVPDFIGFGESSEFLHPYYVKEPTAVAVVDNLKAAYQFAEEKGIDFNGDLFLAGYSQGGYATMAAHQSIEETPLEGFDLRASFPASGGYDVKGMQEYFFSLETYDQPFFLAYVALAYQEYYEWEEPLTDFFNEPFAGRIQGLFDGAKGGNQINAQLSDSIKELVKTDVLLNIDTNEDYAYLVTAFEENSLIDWVPTRKVFMYHGDADITVPYQNSVDSYEQLIENGTSTDVLTFTTLEGGTHYTGVIPYIEQFVPLLLDMND